MKADLTLPQNRAAFMALYLYQPVFVHKDGHPVPVEVTGRLIFDNDIKDGNLSLRHISSLTEEEETELSEITGLFTVTNLLNAINNNLKYSCQFSIALDAIDFLRSIGILIPFRGNSCKELIEAGLCVYRKEAE